MPEFVGDLTCVYCSEPLDGLDAGMLIGNGTQPIHRCCLLRMTVGSLGHQKRLCHCYGGTQDDPPGLTKREAARAAALFYEQQQACPECGETNGHDCVMPDETLYVISCPPFDTAAYTKYGLPPWKPRAGFELTDCQTCKMPCWIGPRQEAMRRKKGCVVACWICAALNGARKENIRSLGG